MFKLAYVSRAAGEMPPGEVDRIVVNAQHKNAEWGITGFLCLRDGMFLQCLEGEESAVRELFNTIRQDSRHDIVAVADLGHSPERSFPAWKMRFLEDHFLGQRSLEDALEGAVLEMGRGTLNESHVAALANRVIDRIALAAV